MPVKLIADSGATKCEWCLLYDGKKKTILTQGISPYFLNEVQIVALLRKELLPKIKPIIVDEIYYYGTGLSNAANVKIVKIALRKLFPQASIEANHDLLAAARAVCGKEKGIACILGTGSNSCYYNGKKVVKNSPGLGYVLGDEGAGSYLGKKVVQHYLYKTYDEELMARFEDRFKTSMNEILDKVYKQPMPNRYLASFSIFLSENRGHYMIENIIEDGLNDFFFHHICKYGESWKLPIHFVGSISAAFKDVIKNLCSMYELEMGQVMKNPMKGLVEYHKG